MAFTVATGKRMPFDLKQYFYNPVCFHCGSLFVELHLFCESCFTSEILPRMSLKKRTLDFEEAAIPHFYLFDWVPGESDLLSSMIYQLKSNRCESALKFYAEIMTEALIENCEDEFKFNCVLPLPGSSKKSLHSNIIAECVSQNLELICQDVFIKEQDEIQQKKLNSGLRKQVRVGKNTKRLSELFTRLKEDKPRPIYVDDVLTTGNTLKASIKAIGASENACALTLFYRPTRSEATFKS